MLLSFPISYWLLLRFFLQQTSSLISNCCPFPHSLKNILRLSSGHTILYCLLGKTQASKHKNQCLDSRLLIFSLISSSPATAESYAPVTLDFSQFQNIPLAILYVPLLSLLSSSAAPFSTLSFQGIAHVHAHKGVHSDVLRWNDPPSLLLPETSTCLLVIGDILHFPQLLINKLPPPFFR